MAECSLQEIEATEREQGFEFDYIRFSLADLHGILRSFVVTRKSLGAFLKDGISLFSGGLVQYLSRLFFVYDLSPTQPHTHSTPNHSTPTHTTFHSLTQASSHGVPLDK